ncbi:MAG: hypothetical protein AB7V26_11275, partial [Lysobacterales bacterium]
PEGGGRGGRIIAEGTPEQVAANPASHTGQYLRRVLGNDKDAESIRPARASGSKSTGRRTRKTA